MRTAADFQALRTLVKPQGFPRPVTGNFYFDSRGNKVSQAVFELMYIGYEVTPNIIFQWFGSDCTKVAWYSKSQTRWELYK